MTPDQIIEASQPRNPTAPRPPPASTSGATSGNPAITPRRSSSGSVATHSNQTTGPTSVKPGRSSATSRSAAERPAASTKVRSPLARTSGRSPAASATTSPRWHRGRTTQRRCSWAGLAAAPASRPTSGEPAASPAPSSPRLPVAPWGDACALPSPPPRRLGARDVAWARDAPPSCRTTTTFLRRVRRLLSEPEPPCPRGTCAVDSSGTDHAQNHPSGGAACVASVVC
jgi:hypothetical protein